MWSRALRKSFLSQESIWLRTSSITLDMGMIADLRKDFKSRTSEDFWATNDDLDERYQSQNSEGFGVANKQATSGSHIQNVRKEKLEGCQ